MTVRGLIAPMLVAASFAFALDADIAAKESEDAKLNRAVDLIEQGKLDDAEELLKEIDKADDNYWQRQLGIPQRHWITADYQEVIKRRRKGDRTDQLFSSKRFRFHAHGFQLTGQEIERLKGIFEKVLTRVAQWAGEEKWQQPYYKTIFVEFVAPFTAPSPARTLIFFWDRQDRSPRTEISVQLARSEYLESTLAHEMTHAVLPHTCRPLAEGMANLAMNQLYPGQELPLRRRGQLAPFEPWPLEEVLLFNVRAQGKMAQEAYVSIRKEGGLRGEGGRIIMGAYMFGDQLVDMIQTKWGREKLFDFYRSTNRDPAAFNMLEMTAQKLAPFEELRTAWVHHLKQSQPEKK